MHPTVIRVHPTVIVADKLKDAVIIVIPCHHEFSRSDRYSDG
jgi:hypothetical protein